MCQKRPKSETLLFLYPDKSWNTTAGTGKCYAPLATFAYVYMCSFHCVYLTQLCHRDFSITKWCDHSPNDEKSEYYYFSFSPHFSWSTEKLFRDGFHSFTQRFFLFLSFVCFFFFGSAFFVHLVSFRSGFISPLISITFLEGMRVFLGDGDRL